MPRNKKAASGSGSIRERTKIKNGKTYSWFEGRITTGRDPGTGKQIQRSVSGKKKEEVRKKLSKIATEIDEGIYMKPSKQTLGEWLDTHVAYSVKPYTEDSYRAACKNHIKPSLGNVRLEVLNAPQIQQLYNKLIRQKGLSAKIVKNVHGVLHRALNQVVRIGILRCNPSNACDLPMVYQKEIVPLEQEKL